MKTNNKISIIEAFNICIKLILLVFVAILILLVGDIFYQHPAFKGNWYFILIRGFSSWLILGLLSYWAYHQSLSLKFPHQTTRIDQFRRFIWRYAIIVLTIELLGFFPNMLLQTGIYDGVDNYNGLNYIFSYKVAVGLIGKLGFEFLVLSLFGIWLPASILNTQSNILMTFNKCRKFFLYTFSRLFVGPGLISILFSVVSWDIVAGRVTGKSHFTELTTIDITWMRPELLFPFVDVYVTVLVTVIISRTYFMIFENTKRENDFFAGSGHSNMNS